MTKKSISRKQPKAASTKAAKAIASPEARMLAKLKESGLDLKDAKALKLKPYTDAGSGVLNLSRAGAGFRIPYFAYTGEPLEMFRYRYFQTKAKNAWTGTEEELRKYDQPFKSDPEIYLPTLPNVNWAEIITDPQQSVILTEGELKSACAAKYVMPCIGLGGVWSFGRKARYQPFLPALEQFEWPGRTVYICYDSDAVTNRLVVSGEIRLARILTDKGATVKIVRIPPEPGSTQKVGIDDYIVKYGADNFKELLFHTDEYGPFAALHDLNNQVIFVRHPSMVIEYPKDDHPEDQSRYKVMQPSKFVKEVYANLHYFTQVDGKNVERKTAADWLEWGARAEVHSVTYAPGAGTRVNGQFNFWEGWGVEPRKGDVTPFVKYFDHVTQGMKPEHKKWLLQWLAYPIQHPGVKLYTAVAFWGPQGSGKSLLGYSMQRVYGENFKEVEKNDLEDQFNSWLANRQFIMGEEITGSDKREFADRLKHLITGHTLTLKEKYVPNYTIPNRVNFYFTSNHQDALFLDNDDRRYFVHEITANKEQFDFKAYDRWYKSEEGAAALRYYLEYEIDTSDFDPQGEAPRTTAKEAMIRSVYGIADTLAYEISKAEDGTFLMPSASFYGDNVLETMRKKYEGRDLWTADQIVNEYAAKNPNDRDLRYLNKYTLPRALKRQGFQSSTGDDVRITLDGKERKARVWVLFHRDKYIGIDGDELGAKFTDQWSEKSDEKQTQNMPGLGSDAGVQNPGKSQKRGRKGKQEK
jgi:hypothetical protein